MLRTLCSAALLLVASTPAWGATPFAHNLTVRFSITRVGSAGGGVEETEYWTGTKRISDNAHKRVIVDFDKQTLTTAYKDKKTFSVESFDDIRQRAEELRKRLSNLPPQMLAQVHTGAAPVEVRPTGKSEQLLGYEIKEYALQGPLNGSVWAAESVEVAAAAQEFAKVVAQIGDPSTAGRQLAEGLAQIKGLPLKMSVATTGQATREVTNTVAVEITANAPPTALLDVPEGYVKMETPKATPQ